MAEMHGFLLADERKIPEINSKVRLFIHMRSGARLLSIENDDENKVFSITFRTPPGDSTGVAHILEHSTLCGSQKYPVKEPFVELVKGSLNTFLNAFTFPDKTTYPVASQNLQDFYNLIDVYMDAVFFPLIAPETLDQEGWHYELDELDGPLTYKGVVFNEMKGAYSSPDSLLAQRAQQSLFPDHVYGFDYGGHPHSIPDLTYAQFKAFHDTYYHPSNSWIYFYGDDDPEERLRRMDAVLSKFQTLQVDSSISLKTRFTEPMRLESFYDPGDAPVGKKGMLVVNWMIGETADREKSLSLAILEYCLIGTPASPLRKALIDSGLGDDLAGVGMEGDLRQIFFSIGLKGVADGLAEDKPADYDKVENLVLETLSRLAQIGIDPNTIAAAMNTIEFRLRENNTGSFPRGLGLLLRTLTTWLYDGDPFAPLVYETAIASIKQRYASGERIFENLIKTELLENPHRTTVLLKPQPGLNQLEEAAEREKLAGIRATLSEEELKGIYEHAQQLRIRQETPDSPEALATLPGLTLDDLDREIRLIPMEVTSRLGTQLLYHDLFTNGIVYLDLGFDVRNLPGEYLQLAPMFGRSLLGLGTETEDFVKLSQRIGRTTGGIRSSFYNTQLRNVPKATTWLLLRGKSTMDHTQDMLAILKDVLLTVRLDNQERFKQMVLEEKADMESAAASAGHRFANIRLKSFFSQAGWVDEQMGGASYLAFLRELAAQVDSDWPAVLAKLEKMRSLLVNRNTMIANITLDQSNWEFFQPQLLDFLNDLPAQPVQQASWQTGQPQQDTAMVAPVKVNYVGKGANLFDLGYRLDGSAYVINNFLRNTWLWEKVRIQGGAYGAFCIFDPRSGILTLLSYRDPNLLATLNVYDQTGQFLRQLDETRLSQEELVKSIIGTIGDLDAYQLPDAKGYTSMARYLAGDTDELRQQRRDEVLSTTLEDFHAYGEVLEQLGGAGRVVVVGSEEAITAANAGSAWLAVEKIS